MKIAIASVIALLIGFGIYVFLLWKERREINKLFKEPEKYEN